MIIFTNSSATRCALRGYPFVQLQYRGRTLGLPAVQNPGTVRTVLLRPGQTAQASVTAVTTCQSSISDHALVRVPGAAGSVEVTIALRGCSISIDPLEAG